MINIQDIPIDRAEFAVLDFETTGNSAKNSRVIEVGIVKIRELEIYDTFQTFINPQEPIPYFITELTGITENDVRDAPPFEDITEPLINFIGDGVLAAHNLAFDNSFLQQELLRAGYEIPEVPKLCTLKLARRLYPSLPSKSLSALVENFKIKHINVHRALGDAAVTAKLLLRMIEDMKENFDVKNLADMLKFQGVPVKTANSGLLKKSVEGKYSQIPKSPGIYMFKDKAENYLYIGKSKSLRDRITGHFQETSPRKSKKIIKNSSEIDFRETNTELTALIAEAETIKSEKPEYNSFLKKYSLTYFIKVNLNHKFPHLTTVSKINYDGNDYFGPYPKRDISGRLLEIIDRSFQLRECNEKTFRKGNGCYLSEIGRCTAPCLNYDVDNYSRELRLVYEFLEGQNNLALERMIGKMKKLSEELKFEEAAQYRDTVNLLLKQLNKSALLAEPVNLANVLLKAGKGEKSDYLLLTKGRVVIKDFLLNKTEDFEQTAEDFYSGAINLFHEYTPQDLERLHITMTWFTRNKEQVKVFYLKDYKNSSELFRKVFT